jgi:hypothetical protein
MEIDEKDQEGVYMYAGFRAWPPITIAERRGDTCPVCGDVRTKCCDVQDDLVDAIKALVNMADKDYLSNKRRDVLNQASRALLRAGRG